MNLPRRLEHDQPWQSYVYRWGNNEKRASLRGRTCRVLARLAKNSALIEFSDGQREVVSRNALKKEVSRHQAGSSQDLLCPAY